MIPIYGFNSHEEKINAYLTFFVFLLTFICFSSSLTHTFGFNNDYAIFNSKEFVETSHLIAIGRPIQAYLLNLQIQYINDMESLRYMRVVIVATIAGCACIFFKYLSKYIEISRPSAFLLSILIFILPSMAVNSFWVAQSVPGVIPVYLAICAKYAIKAGVPGTKWASLLSCIVAFILIFIGLLTYPPATFFFLSLTFIEYTFGLKPRSATGSYLILDLCVFIAACLLYFFIIRYLYPQILSYFDDKDFSYSVYLDNLNKTKSAYSFSIDFNVEENAKRVLMLFVRMLSGWFSIVDHITAMWLFLVYAITCLWVSLSSYWLKHFRIIYRIVTGICVALFLPLALSAPIFVHDNISINYRATLAASSIAPALLLFIVDRIIRFIKLRVLKIGIFLCVCTLSMLAYARSFDRVALISEKLEYQYSTFVNQVTNSSIQTDEKVIKIFPIYFDLSPEEESLIGGFLRIEFGTPDIRWYGPYMVQAVAKDLSMDIQGKKVQFDNAGAPYVSSIADQLIFAKDGRPDYIDRYEGIGDREGFGRWTISPHVQIIYKSPLPKKFILTLETGASKYVVNNHIKVTVAECTVLIFIDSEIPKRYEVPISTDAYSSSLNIEFADDPFVNQERKLGLALVSLKVSTSTTVHPR